MAVTSVTVRYPIPCLEQCLAAIEAEDSDRAYDD
jgi:hypothetical protein